MFLNICKYNLGYLLIFINMCTYIVIIIYAKTFGKLLIGKLFVV